MTEQKTRFWNEIRLIPWWAVVIALAAFGAIVYLLPHYGFRHEPSPPSVPWRYVIALLPGTLLGLTLLAVGYVNRDAKRRGMNVALWTLLCFLPNAIGFILYFLLRHPLQINCPQCGASLSQSFNFCPQCKYNLHPACPKCQHTIHPGDKYCPNCALELPAA